MLHPAEDDEDLGGEKANASGRRWFRNGANGLATDSTTSEGLSILSRVAEKGEGCGLKREEEDEASDASRNEKGAQRGTNDNGEDDGHEHKHGEDS